MKINIEVDEWVEFKRYVIVDEMISCVKQCCWESPYTYGNRRRIEIPTEYTQMGLLIEYNPMHGMSTQTRRAIIRLTSGIYVMAHFIDFRSKMNLTTNSNE